MIMAMHWSILRLSFTRNEGVYPSTITLQNPNNPFRESSTDKWLIENSGFPSAAFYSLIHKLGL